jgi:hypothetical protein
MLMVRERKYGISFIIPFETLSKNEKELKKRKEAYSVSAVVVSTVGTVVAVVAVVVSSAPLADRLAMMPNFVSGVYAPPA